MSSFSVPSAATATPAAVNVHPHGHGHKKGDLLDPFTDSSGSTVPLFGSLLKGLQLITGAQPAIAKPAASAAAAGGKLNVMA